MDVMTAILTRRSEAALAEPAPGDAEFTYLLRGAATAPDHGRLRPWRWITLRGADREALGECLAAQAPPGAQEGIRRSQMRAPLLAALVFAPHTGHRIPQWEQLAATSAMTHALLLLLHSRGYGSIWRTGRLARSPAAAGLLGLGGHERLLGALSIGTAVGGPQHRKELADVSAQVSAFAP